jgi:hypothetical protein
MRGGKALRGALRVMACGLAVAAAAPGAESPAERVFFEKHPVLRFVGQRLPAAVTLAIPPDPAEGRQIVTDEALRTVFASVLEEFLAPPSTFAGKAGELIGEVCRYRPAQSAEWIGVAVDAILRHSLPTAEKELTDAVAVAIAARPQAAGAVLRRTLRRLDARVAAGGLTMETAGRYAGNAVLTAVNALKAVPGGGQQIPALAAAALEEALSRQSQYLVVETMAFLVKGGAATDGARVGDLAKLAFTKFGRSKQQAAMLCVGALQGAGPDAASAIKDEAALNLPVPFAAFATVVCNAYVAVAAAPAGQPHDISRFMTQSNADYIPAVMIGAISAAPAEAVTMLESGLNRDLVLRGRATTREIVEAAIMACESRAPELAAAAVGRGDLMEGNPPAQIAEGVVRGTPAAGIGAALAAQLAEQGKGAEEIRATAAGAIEGAIGGQKAGALSAITFALAAHSGSAGDVLEQVLVSAPAGAQAAAVLGVLAARRDEAGTLLERALKHGNLAAAQAAPLAAGGAAILDLQARPGAFFRAAAERLPARESAAPGTAQAIVLAAALANPRGAALIAAVAVAGTDLPAETIADTASRGDARFTEAIKAAVEQAVAVRARPAELFSLVRSRIAARPGHAAEIAGGAIAVAPALGHVVGHAAAQAAPGAIPEIVPRLFALAAPRPGAEAETYAALTRGVVHGVSDAGLDPAAAGGAVTAAVVAAIRSVAAIHGGDAKREVAGIVAVIAAAGGAAPGNAVEIARSAARTVRALSSPAAEAATLRAAVIGNGPRGEAARVSDAIAAGFAEADRQVPAATVKALFDYAHDSLTGPPMTRFRDL